MARPLRMEFPGAVYYVSSKAENGGGVFAAAGDARRFLELLGREAAQQRWLCHAYCLTPDGYQFIVETTEANLGAGMGRLNMAYTQYFNRLHGRSGPLFKGRYKAVLVERDTHLLPLIRHMAHEPVRRGLAENAIHYRWGSFKGTATGRGTPDWLSPWAVEQFQSREDFKRYAEDCLNTPSPWHDLREQVFLGGEGFRERAVQSATANSPAPLNGRPAPDQVRAQVAGAAGITVSSVLDAKAAPQAFKACLYLMRRAANMPLKQVAELAGVSPGRVSQIQRLIEDAGGLTAAFPWAEGLEES